MGLTELQASALLAKVLKTPLKADNSFAVIKRAIELPSKDPALNIGFIFSIDFNEKCYR